MSAKCSNCISRSKLKDLVLYSYDAAAEIKTQVQQPFAPSLENLGTNYIDCLVLHSLYADLNDTLRAWRAIETLVPDRIGLLGGSNTDLDTLLQSKLRYHLMEHHCNHLQSRPFSCITEIAICKGQASSGSQA